MLLLGGKAVKYMNLFKCTCMFNSNILTVFQYPSFYLIIRFTCFENKLKKDNFYLE